MGGTCAEGIQGAIDQGSSKDIRSVRPEEVVGNLVEKMIRYKHQSNPLPGITEGFGTGNKQNIILGILGNGGLVRWLTRMTVIFPEVHAKVGKILDDNDIILCCKFPYYPQFLISKTDP